MSEQTAIAWCDSTWNPWIGCSKISPGCLNCYAETLDKNRFSKTLKPAVVHWGPGAPRHRTSPANWREPYKWNEKARKSGKPWRVFCSSMADIFDNEVDPTIRDEVWSIIYATPHLTWLLLSKRIGNARDMLPANWSARNYPNVALGATVVNQEELARDWPKLAAIPCALRFLSMEPLLQRTDLCETLGIWWSTKTECFESYDGRANAEELGWVIVGGESGPGARYFNLDWARHVVRACKAARVPVFVKQIGAYPIDYTRPSNFTVGDGGTGAPIHMTRHKAGADPSEWPAELRVQEFPS